ncbi:MAG: right-handed parallel beta-helix repeat-containing protein [Gemmatimonadales bacterium]
MRRAVVPLIALIIAASATLDAQSALVGMYPAGVGLDSGQRATVPIVADLRPGSYSLGSYQLTLTFDPSVVRYVSAQAGGLGVPVVNAGNAATGTIVLGGASTLIRTGLVTVAEVTFEMLHTTGSSPVAIISPELTAPGTFASIPTLGTSGTICTSAGTFGDVNGDGSILSNDALLIVTAAVGLPIAPYTLSNADVDNDGDADTRDALIVLTSAVGLPTTGFRVGQASGGCGGSPAVTLAVNPGTVSLAVGDVVPVSVQLLDAGGLPTSANGVVWSSDAPGVVTVDSSGRITAVGNGTAIVTAAAIGVSPQSVAAAVQDRHTWYVDAPGAATQTVHLGSSAYPFGEIQEALDAATPGDTVMVMYAPARYGPVTISKAVTVLGDSDVVYGMPRIRNSSGPAIRANATGTVTLRHLALEESNAGLDARADSLIVQSVSVSTLRGPGFVVHGMQLATLADISVNSAVLAGVFADSNGFVEVNGANIRAIANRNDSAAAIVVLHGATAQVLDAHIRGVERGSAVVLSGLGRGVMQVFDARTAGGVNIDSVGNMVIGQAQILDASGTDRALSIHSDSVSVDSVIVNGTDRAVEISPMARDTATQPNTFLNLTRSAVLNVAGAGGLIVDRFANVHISRMTVANVQLEHGIEVRRPTVVRIDSANVAGIAEGFAVRVDPAASLLMIGGRLRGHSGGLSVDRIQNVLLTGVEVDSSAVPTAFCFSCTPRIAVSIAHADSVVLDSLNIHDNVGGGILVDSARVLAGWGTAALRNLGFTGTPECQECVGSIKRAAQFTLSNFPGVVVNMVQDSRLFAWTVHDNGFGGLFFTGWDALTGATAQVSNSSFRAGAGALLSASGNYLAPSGALAVQGGSFRGGRQAVSGSYLDRLEITGATIDSAGDYYYPAVLSSSVRNVALVNDTLTRARGWGMQVLSADTASAVGNVIRDGQPVDPFSQEAALEFVSVGTGVIYGNRLERNAVRGIIVRSGSGPMTIDSNVVADDSGFAALQLHQPATVRWNLFARNFNGIFVDDFGASSVIRHNNFEGSVFDGLRNLSATAVVADSNYWGDALGPRCATGCDTTSTGDNISGPATYLPFENVQVSGALIAAPRFLPVSRRTQ